MTALWTHGPPPADLVDQTLCELFHCRPSELDQEDAARMIRHLVIYDVKKQIEKMKWKNRKK